MTLQGTVVVWAVYMMLSWSWTWFQPVYMMRSVSGTWFEPVTVSHVAVGQADPGLAPTFPEPSSVVW